jgi:hypothetical protein
MFLGHGVMGSQQPKNGQGCFAGQVIVIGFIDHDPLDELFQALIPVPG